jgi:hypothetical protein
MGPADHRTPFSQVEAAVGFLAPASIGGSGGSANGSPATGTSRSV